MSKITRVSGHLVALQPKVKRTDAIQAFVAQETPIITIHDEHGCKGVGYAYTIGTGGSSIVRLLEEHLAPQLLGRDPDEIEHIWRDLKFSTNATTVGPITSLALAAIDTALWDYRARRQGLPIWKLVGGASPSRPLYTTEGGWLHLPVEALVEDALRSKAQGFTGAKLKVGKPTAKEDYLRLAEVRKAVGSEFEIMTDFNQSQTLPEAIRRARMFEELDIAWIEEPLPADNIGAHRQLCQQTSIPIAIGESVYSLRQFKDYLHHDACTVVQADVARVGGITPWLKIAALAEAYDAPLCPHFLMELHAGLACGVQSGRYVEYIPQLDAITRNRLNIKDGNACANNDPGLGIDWDWDSIERLSTYKFVVT